MTRHLLVFSDSLAFHGPERVEPLTDPRLYPNVMARALGDDVRVDLVARLGYTARDGWWALTKDPVVWGKYLPRASGVVLAQGQYDALPAAIPTWLRELIPYLQPGGVRRRVRGAYQWATPRIIAATGGRLQQMSNAATNHYMTRITEGIRYMQPGIPVVRLLPSPYDSKLYPSTRPHAAAVAAARLWCEANEVTGVELDDLVDHATNNADGLHWGWSTHERIGRAAAAALIQAGFPALSREWT